MEGKKGIREIVGRRLKEVRQKDPKYTSMTEFARATGIKDATLYKYERGQALPPLDNFIQICKVLNRPPGYLLFPIFNPPEDDDLIDDLVLKLRDLKKDEHIIQMVKFLRGSLGIYQFNRQMNGDEDMGGGFDRVMKILHRYGKSK